MHAKIDPLLSLLDEETACYQDMQRVLAKEKDAMSFSAKARFDRIELEKEALVVRIQEVEQKRKSVVDQLAQDHGVEAPTLTVTLLAHYLPAPESEKLLTRARQLRSVMADVQASNRHNRQLIGQYLDLIRGSLKLLTHLIDDDAVYRKPGTDSPAMGYRNCSGGRLFCGSV